MRYKYEQEIHAYSLNFGPVNSIDICDTGDGCHIAVYDNGHNGEPDNYSGPDLYVYRLGFDHRRLEFGLYPHFSRRDLQRYDRHALRAEIGNGDTGCSVEG